MTRELADDTEENQESIETSQEETEDDDTNEVFDNSSKWRQSSTK